MERKILQPYFLILVIMLVAACSNSAPADSITAPVATQSTVITPTEAVPTPAAPPDFATETDVRLALTSFWQAMELEAFGVASALFMDVYGGQRQWVQPDELALLYGRAPDLFSAEPTFTINATAAPEPMVYLGGNLILSYGEMTVADKTLPLVVEIHQNGADVRLSRLHVGDTRIYSMPRSLEAGEYQTILRQPVDLNNPLSPTLLVESSIFLERVRGALFFDGLAWEEMFACEDAQFNSSKVIDAIGWNKNAQIEDYQAGLEDNNVVSRMNLKGRFAPPDDPAGVRHFEAVLGVSDAGWCLQNMLVDHNPQRSLRAFFAAYGDALWAKDSSRIEAFWCEGYKDQAEPSTGSQVQFAFEPLTEGGQVVQVNGSRSDVGLFSAEMQYSNARWCFNSLVITDPGQ